MPVPRVLLWLPLLLMVDAALVIVPAAPALVVRRRLLLPLPAALALVGIVGVAPRDEARVLLPAVLSSCVAVTWAAGGGGCCGCRRPMPVVCSEIMCGFTAKWGVSVSLPISK
jgi:hypothetical protein